MLVSVTFIYYAYYANSTSQRQTHSKDLTMNLHKKLFEPNKKVVYFYPLPLFCHFSFNTKQTLLLLYFQGISTIV